MKHVLLTLALIALCAVASAQTGLFGLSFDQSMDAAISTLQAKGFKVTLKETSVVELTNSSIKDLKRVRLFFYEKKLSSWYVYYDAAKKPELKARITKEIEALHGKGQIWDDYSSEWGWKLANDNAVCLREDSEDKELLVTYSYWEEFFGTDEEDWWW